MTPEAKRRTMSRAERTGIALAVVGVVIALVAWLYPRAQDAEPDPTAGNPTRPPASTPPPTSGPGPTAAPAPAGRYLADIAPKTGRANVVELPRALRGQPGYEHALAIACPTNQSGDRERSVVYALDGRYADIHGSIRPYFADRPEAEVRVEVQSAVRQGDGTMTSRRVGPAYAAINGASVAITGDIEDTDDLTLRIQCVWSDGVVVLTDAVVVPSG